MIWKHSISHLIVTGSTRVLVPRAEPTTLHIRCSVATIIRTVAVQPEPYNARWSNYIPTHETSFSITHVYTPVDKRKRGYATRMMSLLHAQLAPAYEGVSHRADSTEPYPTGILSFLYSGFGDFYSRCGLPGWHIQTSRETRWNTDDILQDVCKSGAALAPIMETHFTEVAEAHARALDAELGARAREDKPRAFAVLPTGEEFQWLVARSKFYGAQAALSSRPPPSSWGVRTGKRICVSDDTDDLAIWFFDYVKKELQFLRLRCRDGPTLARIVHAAALAAKEQQCGRLVAWNVDEDLLNSCRQSGRETFDRKKNLAAVAWYGPDKGCPERIANEKYGWC